MDRTLLIVLIAVGFIFSMVIGCYIGLKVGKKLYLSKLHGMIRLAYDPDDPGHPAMGLMLENLDYILSHKVIVLGVEHVGFPEESRKKQLL